MDIGQHYDFSKLLWQFSESLNQFIVGELFGDRFHVDRSLLQFLAFTVDETTEPFPPLMGNHVEQDAEKPGAAVRARCEPLI